MANGAVGTMWSGIEVVPANKHMYTNKVKRIITKNIYIRLLTICVDLDYNLMLFLTGIVCRGRLAKHLLWRLRMDGRIFNAPHPLLSYYNRQGCVSLPSRSLVERSAG